MKRDDDPMLSFDDEPRGLSKYSSLHARSSASSDDMKDIDSLSHPNAATSSSTHHVSSHSTHHLAAPSIPPTTTLALHRATSTKEKEEKSDKSNSNSSANDSKYFEQFISSVQSLSDDVREKIGLIKGLEKAIQMKSAAVKDASTYHVQMIREKLTPPAKKEGDMSAAGGSTNATSSNDSKSSSSNAMDTSSSMASTNNVVSLYNPSSSLNNTNSLYGGGSNSNVNNASSSSSSSHLSQAPTSALTPAMPYTLTPTVIGPLTTETLWNSITYLLVAPIKGEQSNNSSGLTNGMNGNGEVKNENEHMNALTSPTLASTPSAASSSSSSAVPQHMSKTDLGIYPMHISSSAYPPLTKKQAGDRASAANAASLIHTYSSIPSPYELSLLAIPPAQVDVPESLTNASLQALRNQTTAAYDLDAAERLMRTHHVCLADWQRRKITLTATLSELITTLQTRVDNSLKKYEQKLRRNIIEVTQTPIDRRRTTAPPAVSATPGHHSSSAGAISSDSHSTTASSAHQSSSSFATPSSHATAATTLSHSPSSRKRRYSTLIHEFEQRELQFQLQQEIKQEIEKQASQAMVGANGGSAGHTIGGINNTSLGASGMTASGGVGPNGSPISIDTSVGVAAPHEPLYCICRKVSFGSMVACDNPTCATEWFHFACVNLDTKPRGKWICEQCQIDLKKKKKKQKIEAAAAAATGGTPANTPHGGKSSKGATSAS